LELSFTLLNAKKKLHDVASFKIAAK